MQACQFFGGELTQRLVPGMMMYGGGAQILAWERLTSCRLVEEWVGGQVPKSQKSLDAAGPNTGCGHVLLGHTTLKLNHEGRASTLP